MQKMFVCEDGTMFPTDEVLSVEEAKTYLTKQGDAFCPNRIFSSKKDMEDAIQLDLHRTQKLTPREHTDLMLEDVSVGLFKLVWWPLGKILRTLSKTSEEERVRLGMERERRLEKQMKEYKEECAKERWNFYVENGYYFSSENMNWCLKQWEVKVRDQKKTIRISNADHDRLCAEVGK